MSKPSFMFKVDSIPHKLVDLATLKSIPRRCRHGSVVVVDMKNSAMMRMRYADIIRKFR